MDFIIKEFFGKLRKMKKPLIKQLKERLERLEENLIHGQQLAKTGSWTHKLHTDEIFLTEEVYNILGSSPQDFDGKLDNYYLFIHPDDLDYVKKATEGALLGKEYDIEYRIVTPDGSTKYVHEKTKAVYAENNNPIKMVGIIQDITNRKILENNLKAMGDNLIRAQRVAGIGSWQYDVIKDEFSGTEEMFNIYGIDPSEFNNDYNNTTKLVHPDDQHKIKNALELHLRGSPCQKEFRIPQKNGTMKYVIGKGEPIFDDEQKVIGIVGTLQDITQKKLLEEKLEKTCKNLSDAQRLASMGSWEFDIANGEIFLSEESYRLIGMDPEQFDGTYEKFLKYVHPDDVSVLHNILNYPSKQPFDMEFRVIRADGSIRNIYQLVEIVFDDNNNPVYIRGTTQDITEKKELKEQLKENQTRIDKIQKRFEILVRESSDVFEILAPDGTIKYMSEASEKIIGYTPVERIGKRIYEYYDKENQQKLREMIDFVMNSPHQKAQGDVIFKTKAGKEIYLEVHMQNLMHEPIIDGIVVNFRDITKRIEMEKKIIHISTHDELTGLPNRICFKNELDKQCQYARETNSGFAIMMLDIDGFKYINDALGYILGDQLILSIAERLKSLLSNKHFICRYSADRFGIILHGLTTIEEYETIAKSVVGLFEQTFKVDKYDLDITMCIGISIYRKGQDADILTNHAEIALFWAKKSGKNRYKFYSSDINIQNYKQFELRNDLRKALENNEFLVYYQPIVRLKTHEILAAEALIRWEHPNWGMISPNEFINLAEETGLITNIGNWLLREICRNYKQWLEKGLPNIKVAFNFSSVQFLETNFIEKIIDTIKEFELDPHFLIMEITESVLMARSEKTIDDIRKLRSYGIQIALDDFGTGYSSLAYLNSLNIDMLKIDGSFVRNSVSDKASGIITKTIINMARELKTKLVAEEIENWQQLSYLRKLNCYAGQGHLYSKPLPLEDFEKILARKKCKPITIKNIVVTPYDDRRKFFRVKFPFLLETELTVLEIKGKKVNVGNTKVLVKNLGPGGLCFISNIKLPIQKDIILQFEAELLGNEIKIKGYPVWTEEMDNNLYEYGVEFSIDENERTDLIRILNQVQVRIRKDILFSEGSFVTVSPNVYFKSHTN